MVPSEPGSVSRASALLLFPRFPRSARCTRAPVRAAARFKGTQAAPWAAVAGCLRPVDVPGATPSPSLKPGPGRREGRRRWGRWRLRQGMNPGPPPLPRAPSQSRCPGRWQEWQGRGAGPSSPRPAPGAGSRRTHRGSPGRDDSTPLAAGQRLRIHPYQESRRGSRIRREARSGQASAVATGVVRTAPPDPAARARTGRQQ